MLSLDAENWQLWRILTMKGGLQESVLDGLPREMSMSDRHRNTMEHLNNVVSRNLRSSDRWTYRTLVVTLSSISKKWKITGLFVPFSGFFLIWNLGFLPRHSDGESPRVEPKSPSDHLEVSHGGMAYVFMMFLMLRLRDVLSLPWQGATTEAHDAWYSSHQFTYRWLSQGPCHVAWFGILVASRCGSAVSFCCYFITFRNFTRFHFRTSILSVFSRHRPRWFSRPQNEGPETRCIQLVPSHDRHSSNMLNHIRIKRKCQSVNKNTGFLLSLCSLRSLSIISKAKVRSHSGIDSNFRTWTWHNMRWVRLPTTCWFLRNSVNVSIDIRTFPLITPDYICTTHYTKR